jgi:lipopolysaccharide biosynthesis glycosyltransferase
MKTVVVTLTDQNYFHKCKRTILDIRSRGEWTGDLVLITVGFDAPPNFLDYYNITQKRVEHLDCSAILEAYRLNPIRPTCDNREFAKLTQWDKFYVFDHYFAQWQKVIFLDAGLRVVDKIQYLADLPCENVIMAPDDAPSYDNEKRFGGIIETDRNPEVVSQLFTEYPQEILQERYFLNCIWMYDTALLKTITMKELVDAMNTYPICRCNEMTIMNLIFTFKYKVWKPFPEFVPPDGTKRLFGWTEWDRDYGYTSWRTFCFLKYPTTINFDCE